MCRFNQSYRYRFRGEAGFTLIEALVALALVAVSLTAIGSLVAASVRGTRTLEQRLALLETTRAILTSLPDRDQLAAGDMSEMYGDHRWRLDVMPFAADFIDPRIATPWVPQAIVLRVQSPTGELLRIDTVRLRRATAGDR